MLCCLILCVPLLGHAQGSEKVSVSDLETMVRADSNDAVLHLRLGIAYAASGGKGDVEKAWHALQTAVRIDPQLAAAYGEMARISSAEFDLALLSVLRTLLLVPVSQRGDSLLRSASDSLLRAKGDSFLQLTQRAFQLDPLMEVWPTSAYHVPMYWKGTIDHALHEFHNQKYQQALTEFDALITRTTKRDDPTAVPDVALWYHALAADRLGNYDLAIRDMLMLLDAAMTLEQRDSVTGQKHLSLKYEYVLAHLRQRAGQLDEAKRLFQDVSQQNLGLYAAHIQLANMAEQAGHRDEAILERRRAIAANPDDPSLVFDLGVTLLKGEAFSQADTVLLQAIERNPRETRAYYALGLTLERLGKPAEARGAYTQFLALAPRRLDAQIADARRHLAALP